MHIYNLQVSKKVSLAIVKTDKLSKEVLNQALSLRSQSINCIISLDRLNLQEEELSFWYPLAQEYIPVFQCFPDIQAFISTAKSLFNGNTDALFNGYLADEKIFQNHIKMVSAVTGLLSEALCPELKETIKIGTILHDIGKLFIPYNILYNKKIYKTDAIERKIISYHVIYGNAFLQSKGFSQEIINCAYLHHERTDGSGYVKGLKNLPIEASILAVADVYSALREDRPYRRSDPDPRTAFAYLEANKKQFNPEVVDTLKKVIADVEQEFKKI